MFCYQVSEDEALDMWQRMMTGDNIMAVYVPWCVWIYDRYGSDYVSSSTLHITMHHWSEFVAFLTRKKLEGKYHEY